MSKLTVSKDILIALLAIAVLATAPAFGHAKLQSSSPANQARLAAAPSTLTLTFNESAQLAKLELETLSKDIPVTLDHSAKASTTVTVALPALAPDTYEVQWTAMAADDGHITKGSFTFTVVSAKST